MCVPAEVYTATEQAVGPRHCPGQHAAACQHVNCQHHSDINNISDRDPSTDGSVVNGDAAGFTFFIILDLPLREIGFPQHQHHSMLCYGDR